MNNKDVNAALMRQTFPSEGLQVIDSVSAHLSLREARYTPIYFYSFK